MQQPGAGRDIRRIPRVLRHHEIGTGILLRGPERSALRIFLAVLGLASLEVSARSAQSSSCAADALGAAIGAGNHAAVATLLEQGASPNTPACEELPLVLAVQQQDPELVRLLLRHHAEPDCRTSIGRPILTEVLLAKSPVADYERGLRQGTADQQEEGLSLRDHIRDIRWTLLKELLQNGAHPDLADQGGNTPLMTASVLLELADVEALLAAGANPNAQNDRGVTPLMLTCLAIGGGKQARLTSADIVESLLKHGADPNHQSSTGESALMRAAGEDNTAAMKVLRKYGARTDLRDKEGKDALAYARANHREEAVGTIVWWRKGSRRH